jgi:hypothetical protein
MAVVVCPYQKARSRFPYKLLGVVDGFRHECGILSGEALAPALEPVFARGRLTPGAALALGFAGWKQWSDGIRSAFLTSSSDSELAQACAVALTWLEDHDLSTVPALKRLLAVRRDLAIPALLSNASPPAIALLTEELNRRFEPALAADLLRVASATSDTIPIVRRQLLALQGYARTEALSYLVSSVDPAVVAECINDSELDDFIREAAFAAQGPFRSVGARAVVVRLLAMRDPAAAFLAAEAALRSNEEPDRERWPYLLIELDEQRAVEVLLNQALVETKTRVVRAIGRSLAAPAGVAAVSAWLADPDATKRLAACRLAGWMGPSRPLSDLVRGGLEDPDSRVASEALAATELLGRAEAAREAVDAFEHEADPAHRWTLLDGLIAISDPGDAGRPRPWWSETIGPGLLLAMKEYATHKLQRARDKAGKDADRLDR